MSVNMKQQIEFIKEQVNMDYSMERVNELLNLMKKENYSLHLNKFDVKKFTMTLLNVMMNKKKEGYNETFFIVNVYTILKELMKKYIQVNHLEELSEFTLKTKIKIEKMIKEQKGNTETIYNGYLSVLENYILFIEIKTFSIITDIYIKIFTKLFNKVENVKGKDKIEIKVKDIEVLAQPQFTENMLLKNEIYVKRIMKKLKNRRNQKVIF